MAIYGRYLVHVLVQFVDGVQGGRWTQPSQPKLRHRVLRKVPGILFLYLVEICKTNRAHLTNCGVFLSTVKVVGSLSQAWVSKPRTVFGCRPKIRKS